MVRSIVEGGDSQAADEEGEGGQEEMEEAERSGGSGVSGGAKSLKSEVDPSQVGGRWGGAE